MCAMVNQTITPSLIKLKLSQWDGSTDKGTCHQDTKMDKLRFKLRLEDVT